jgi:regulator of replication initiation timing
LFLKIEMEAASAALAKQMEAAVSQLKTQDSNLLAAVERADSLTKENSKLSTQLLQSIAVGAERDALASENSALKADKKALTDALSSRERDLFATTDQLLTITELRGADNARMCAENARVSADNARLGESLAAVEHKYAAVTAEAISFIFVFILRLLMIRRLFE